MSKVHKYYYQPVFVLRTLLQVVQAHFPTLALEDSAGSQPSPLVLLTTMISAGLETLYPLNTPYPKIQQLINTH